MKQTVRFVVVLYLSARRRENDMQPNNMCDSTRSRESMRRFYIFESTDYGERARTND
jgi:hypothetical protein